jgi:GNAT superfamily N-acetyltransferase
MVKQHQHLLRFRRSSFVKTEAIIRPAIKTDLPLIRPLLSELMEAMADTEGFDLDRSIENCRMMIRYPAQHVLVAVQGSNILGLVNFTMRKTITHPSSSGLIDELIVSESSRGKGIAKQLIRAAIDKCREFGCCELEVSTERSNTKARRFYRACGFKEDAVLLELDLMETDGE